MTAQKLYEPCNTAFLPFTRSHEPNQPLEGRRVPMMHTQAIGEIVEAFADLEETIRLGIVQFQGTAPPNLTFDSKVELMKSLAHQHDRDNGLGLEDAIDRMTVQWQVAKQLRDRILRLPPDLSLREEVLRHLGATPTPEDISNDQFDVGYLLDIADFITSMAGNTEDFLLQEASTAAFTQLAARNQGRVTLSEQSLQDLIAPGRVD